ncbi:hypothetical protein D3C85_1217280 [compost metagenome]
MIGFMLTSLKVVSIAVSFFTATKRFATVLRNGDIFCLRSFLEPEIGAVTGATAAGAALGCAFSAFNASSLVILPLTPVPFTDPASTPFSARIFPADGDGVPVA